MAIPGIPISDLYELGDSLSAINNAFATLDQRVGNSITTSGGTFSGGITAVDGTFTNSVSSAAYLGYGGFLTGIAGVPAAYIAADYIISGPLVSGINASFIDSVSAARFIGDGSFLTGIITNDKLSLSGGQLTGDLYLTGNAYAGNTVNVSTSAYIPTVVTQTIKASYDPLYSNVTWLTRNNTFPAQYSVIGAEGVAVLSSKYAKFHQTSLYFDSPGYVATGPGAGNKAIKVTGSNYLTVSNSTYFTVEFWIYVGAYPNTSVGLDDSDAPYRCASLIDTFSKTGGATTNGFCLGLKGDGTFIIFTGTTGSTPIAASIPLRSWSHVVLTKINNTVYVGVNGTFTSAGITHPTISTVDGAFYIGGSPFIPGYFAGLEYGLSDTAISDYRITVGGSMRYSSTAGYEVPLSQFPSTSQNTINSDSNLTVSGNISASGFVYGNGSNLIGIALSNHTHAISGVTNLQTTLDGKLNLTGGTLNGGLTGTTAGFTGNVGIGTTTPARKLDVIGDVGTYNIYAGNIYTGVNTSTGDAAIELGFSRTGNGAAYFDLHTAAGNDFEFRIGKDAGVNGSAYFVNVGTGALYLTQFAAAPILLQTNNTERMRINGVGYVGIGNGNPGSLLSLGTIGTVPEFALAMQNSFVRMSQRNTEDEFGITTNFATNGVSDTLKPSWGLFMGGGLSDCFNVKRGAAGSASQSTLLWLTSGGNLGIGSTTPTDGLTILRDGNTQFNLERHSSDFLPAFIVGAKRRGTNASKVSVADEDRILSIQSYGYDGTADRHAAAINFEVDHAPANNSVPGRIVFFTTQIGTSETPQEKMRITSNGNVGIGISTPVTKLHIKGETTTPIAGGVGVSQLMLNNSADDNPSMRFGVSMYQGDYNPITQTGDQAIIFSGASTANSLSSNLVIAPYSNSTSGIRMTYDGKVGIGISTPRSRLDVNAGAITGVSNIRGFSNSGAYSMWGGLGTDSTLDGGYIQVYGSTHATNPYLVALGNSYAGTIIAIASGGNVGIGTITPAAKLEVSGIVAIDNSNYAFLRLGNVSNTGWAITKESSDNSFNIFQGAIQGSPVANRLRIDNSGNVGIGTSTPNSKLTVSGNISASGFLYGNGSTLTGITTDTTKLLSLSGGTMTGNLILSGTSTGIGIGTPTLSQYTKLEINGSGITQAKVKNTTSIGDASWVAENTLGIAAFGVNGVGPFVYTSSALPVSIYTNGSERMRVDASGNVGIGTSTPGAKLHVSGSSILDGPIVIGREDSSLEGGQIALRRASDNTVAWYVDCYGAGTTPSFRVFNSENPSLVINNSGNVGVGTSAPSSKLQVVGTVTATAFSGSGANLTNIPQSAVTSLNAALDFRLSRLGGVVSGNLTLSNTTVQLGSDLDGEAAGDNFGHSVSMNSAGDRVAIGAIGSDGTGSNAGLVRIYSWNGSDWTQLGSDLDGEAAGDNFGHSVSMNSAGDRVAIGAIYNDGTGSNAGLVRIYSWNGSAWTQLGSDLDGITAGDLHGHSVSMNSAGDRVAIGAIGSSGFNPGRVRIYSWSGSAWTQLGSTLNGRIGTDYFGYSVCMNSAGDRVVIGAHRNDDGGSNAGAVYVYYWNVSDWAQLGSDLYGAAGDTFGHSVSMNSAGDRIAVGALTYGATSDGQTKIYSWSGSAWTQLGLSIPAEAATDYSGQSVSLNSAGDRVAIGARYNDDNGYASGHTRIYSWNGSSWIKLGIDIDGEAENDWSGWSVSMNSAGDRVAIGAIYNDGNGSLSGHVRVYIIPSSAISASTGTFTTSVSSPAISASTGTFTTSVSSPAVYGKFYGDASNLTETLVQPSIASTTSLDVSIGTVFKISLTTSITTLNFTNVPASPKVFSFVLQVVADGTARTIAWPASVKWPSNAAPSITSTSGKIDTFSFLTYDGGTTWFGYIMAQNH